MLTSISKLILLYDDSKAAQNALDFAMELHKKKHVHIHIIFSLSKGQPSAVERIQNFIQSNNTFQNAKIELHDNEENEHKQIDRLCNELDTDLVLAPLTGLAGKRTVRTQNPLKWANHTNNTIVFFIDEKNTNLNTTLLLPLDSDSETRQKVHYCANFVRLISGKSYIFGCTKEKSTDTLHALNVYMHQAQAVLAQYGILSEGEYIGGVKVAEAILEKAMEQQCNFISSMTSCEKTGLFGEPIALHLLQYSQLPILIVKNKHIEGVGGGGY